LKISTSSGKISTENLKIFLKIISKKSSILGHPTKIDILDRLKMGYNEIKG